MFGLLLLVCSTLAAVDVNSADAAALESLPGIGPGKAQAILAWREANGPFASLEDLDKVDGIGPSTLANLSGQVSFGKGASPTPASAAAPVAKTAAAPAAAAPADTAGCPVNINTAAADGLQTLPGIGASKAAAIVQHREEHGAFGSCDGLDDVNGIGPATLAGLRTCCVVK